MSALGDILPSKVPLGWHLVLQRTTVLDVAGHPLMHVVLYAKDDLRVSYVEGPRHLQLQIALRSTAGAVAAGELASVCLAFGFDPDRACRVGKTFVLKPRPLVPDVTVAGV